jgi:hypothetical protein
MIPGSGANPNGISLQTARLMWIAFLCSACVIITVAHRQKTHPAPLPAASFVWGIAAVGAVDIVVMGMIRRSQLVKADDLNKRGGTEASQKRWASAQLLGFAEGESIVLFGFVLSMMGARPEWLRTAFYDAGLLLLVACWPQPPQ